MSTPKELFEKIGGFDENITNSDDESVDGRVIVNGRIVFFNEKCYCYKDNHKTL